MEIAAPPAKVWEVLWNDATYRQWTGAFLPGSYYKGQFLEGTVIHFLSPGEHGLYAVVEIVQAPYKMYFRHLGEVVGGTEQGHTFGNEAIEQYDLAENQNLTSLTVTLKSTEEFVMYFSSTFPKALAKVKNLAEQN